MGFDVYGPTRHVRASNVDDGCQPAYDVPSLPEALGLSCPHLEKLNRRFYDSTTLRFLAGEVHGLRDELLRLQQAYRERREAELIREHRVRAQDGAVRAAILDQLLARDPTFSALEEFRLLCAEAISARTDVRCEGD